jgi:hypothetical protein
MRIPRTTFVASLLVCLAAFSLVRLRAQATNSSPAPTADTAGSTEKADAASGPAYLRVYRARRVVGSALAPSIVVDGKQVVRVGNGRRATIKLSPGAHAIGSDDKSSSISLDAKSGQEYFVRVDEEPGMWKGHGKLTLLAAEQGSPEYKLQKPVEEERKIAKEMIEDDTEAAK